MARDEPEAEEELPSEGLPPPASNAEVTQEDVSAVISSLLIGGVHHTIPDQMLMFGITIQLIFNREGKAFLRSTGIGTWQLPAANGPDNLGTNWTAIQPGMVITSDRNKIQFQMQGQTLELIWSGLDDPPIPPEAHDRRPETPSPAKSLEERPDDEGIEDLLARVRASRSEPAPLSTDLPPGENYRRTSPEPSYPLPFVADWLSGGKTLSGKLPRVRPVRLRRRRSSPTAFFQEDSDTRAPLARRRQEKLQGLPEVSLDVFGELMTNQRPEEVTVVLGKSARATFKSEARELTFGLDRKGAPYVVYDGDNDVFLNGALMDRERRYVVRPHPEGLQEGGDEVTFQGREFTVSVTQHTRATDSGVTISYNVLVKDQHGDHPPVSPEAG